MIQSVCFGMTVFIHGIVGDIIDAGDRSLHGIGIAGEIKTDDFVKYIRSIDTV